MNQVAEQPTLFNIETTAISPYWIDPLQPLLVPQNPLHFEAHKLQLLLGQLDKQAERNAAQFNSANYIKILDRFTQLCEAINNGVKPDDLLDEGNMAEGRYGSTAPPMGEGITTSVDTGVSADNPLSG